MKSDIAAILVRIERGAALLSMFHPYYGSQDLDPKRFRIAFPESSTNSEKIAAKLSPEKTRMSFVLEKFLFPLKDCN